MKDKTVLTIIIKTYCMAKIGPYIIRLLLLLKHSFIFYKIDRSTNKKYLCDSNFESFLDNLIRTLHSLIIM